jgi:RND family efflux transporter MFP subunit
MPIRPKALSITQPALLFAALAALGIGAGLYSLLGTSSPAPSAPAASGGPAVTVAPPLVRTVTDWAEITGQFVAVDSVEVRARVGGYLTEIRFTDGQMVSKGDLLFVIDPRPFEIAAIQARAKLDQAAGSKELAGRQLLRAGELRRKDFVAESTLDQRTEESRGANATVEAARAAVRDAELNLQFTRVLAPVSGRIGARLVTPGNLVTGGTTVSSPTLLATVVSLDPIHFSFDLSEADFLAQARRAKGDGPPMVGMAAPIRLMDETGWPHEGRIDFVDNQIDRKTGTIRVRAVLTNADHRLVPGAFGRVRLALSDPYEAMLVPDAAITTDQSRQLVMVVKDGTVVPKMVKLGPVQENGLRVVRDGLAPDDQVIVNGLMRARPGAKVNAQTGTIP